MIVIGLTGGIASGKSTVSKFLHDLGAKIIDADKIARDVVVPGTNAWKKIKSEFGIEVLNTDKTINRKKLGQIVFEDEKQRDKLEKITHPEIFGEIEKKIKLYREQQVKLVILDAPLLIEAGNLINMVDKVWVVYVDRRTQLERLQQRDGLTLEEAELRLKAQMDLKEKCKFADNVIDNNGSIPETKRQVETLCSNILHTLK